LSQQNVKGVKVVKSVKVSERHNSACLTLLTSLTPLTFSKIKKTAAMQDKIKVAARTQLAKIYKVHYNTFSKWLKLIPDLDIKANQRTLTPKQVEKIINHLATGNKFPTWAWLIIVPVVLFIAYQIYKAFFPDEDEKDKK
jgi:hypothetical protein